MNTMKTKQFRTLATDEDASFAKWARENWKLGEPIDSLWHPRVREECLRMQCEALEAEQKDPVVSILCQCGWGMLSIPESKVPELCPVCGFNFWEYAERGESC
jgi:hypothetical protein